MTLSERRRTGRSALGSVSSGSSVRVAPPGLNAPVGRSAGVVAAARHAGRVVNRLAIARML